MTRDELLCNYWNYYLHLENKIIGTQNYVEWNEHNYETFSNEFASIIQVTGAELDNFFKAYCGIEGRNYSITNYADFILNDFPEITEQKVRIRDKGMELQPFNGWDTAQASQSLEWWQGYNDIKHNRYINFQKANLKNSLNILGALYILEIKQLRKIHEENPAEMDIPDTESSVFTMTDWKYNNGWTHNLSYTIVSNWEQ